MKKVFYFLVLSVMMTGFVFADGSVPVLTAPNNGEPLTQGYLYNITWTYSGVTHVKLVLWQNEALVGAIEGDINPYIHTYPWKIGKLANGSMVQPGTGFKIRVRTIDNGPYDESDNAFTIIADPKIKIRDAVGKTEVPKKAFFDLKVLRVGVNCMNCGSFKEAIYFPNGTPEGTKNIYLVPDKIYLIYCHYLVDYLPRAQIREIDAKYWGSGKFAFDVDLSIRPPYWCDAPCIAKTKAIKTFYTPKFTWADVQMGGSPRMRGYEVGVQVEWRPGKEDIGKTFIPACRIFPRNHEWQDTDYINNSETDFPVIHVVASLPKLKPGDVAVSAINPKKQTNVVNPKEKKKPDLQVSKPDLVIKSFSLSPQQPVAGVSFILTVEFRNKGSAASAANQQYTQSCKVFSGGPACPVPSATGTLPAIPANGTYKVTLSGLKGPKGSYEIAVKLLPESMNKKGYYAFHIAESIRKIAPAVKVPVQK